MGWNMYHVCCCRVCTSRTAAAIWSLILHKYKWLCRSHHVSHYIPHLRFVLVCCSVSQPTLNTILSAAMSYSEWTVSVSRVRINWKYLPYPATDRLRYWRFYVFSYILWFQANDYVRHLKNIIRPFAYNHSNLMPNSFVIPWVYNRFYCSLWGRIEVVWFEGEFYNACPLYQWRFGILVVAKIKKKGSKQATC